MSGLLACPFCGSKNVKAFAYGQNIGGEPDAFCQCQDCTVTGPNGLNEAEAIAAWNRRAPAAPVEAALTDAALFLLPDDLAALKRFYECSMDFDSGGHDVSKPQMLRLVEIGVVRSAGFGRHMVTSFGDYVLGMDEVVSRKLPLKTYAEYCEDSRIESERAIEARIQSQRGGESAS